MVDVQGAVMVAITVAFLAGLAGLFVVLGSAEADRRLVLAGYRPGEGSRPGSASSCSLPSWSVPCRSS